MLIDRERDRRNQDSALKREARAEGLELRLEQGRLEGAAKMKETQEFTFVQTLIRDTDFDDQRIAALAAVEEDFVEKVRKRTV